MKVNYRKTKLMVFNPGKIRDFLPRFSFNSMELEVVDEIKLLGIVIKNDLSWGANTDFIVQKANRKLWCLRRLKKPDLQIILSFLAAWLARQKISAKKCLI